MSVGNVQRQTCNSESIWGILYLDPTIRQGSGVKSQKFEHLILGLWVLQSIHEVLEILRPNLFVKSCQLPRFFSNGGYRGDGGLLWHWRNTGYR
jgi:hypothetical protein